MKSPLRYQATSYDCGPTTMTNAIIYLFEREEIAPDLIRHIGQCTLDSYDQNGYCGRFGTSGAAIRYFGEWFNELRYAGLMPIRSRFLDKDSVFLGDESEISRELQEGAVVVLHVYYEVGHYILLTGQDEKGIRAFDPYFRGNEVKRDGVWRVDDQPFSHNIILSVNVLNDTGRGYYSMGKTDTREALIISRAESQSAYVI